MKTPDTQEKPAKTVHIKTFGCQMNVYDSERMLELLHPEGYSMVETPEQADLVILNTCHIREKASEKVYSDLGRLRKSAKIRQSNGHDTLIAVAGCVAQAEGAEIMRRAQNVNVVVGPQTYHRLPALLQQLEAQKAQGQAPHVLDTDFPLQDKFKTLGAKRRAQGRTAFLTVQEGCDKFCAFCVVPYTRGAEVSRPVAALLAEARALVEEGVAEITLLGQNVNAFHGVDEKGAHTSLAKLLAKIADIPGVRRLRYTTSHPLDMSQDLIEAHRDLGVLMPYVHLPVQAGSDRILAAMNRRHTVAQYLTIIDKLKKARADLALSGDFIVGFPGESEADFQETLKIVDAVGYAQAYAFKYSQRPGTPAADWSDQVPEEVKIERLARLQEALARSQQRFNQHLVGSQQEILLERKGRRPGQLIGRSPYLQPVHVIDDSLALGDFTTVTIVRAGPNSLEGRVQNAVQAA
jgi:tRNA-2-methylthio-N6-dimethylallyladenosine synthase